MQSAQLHIAPATVQTYRKRICEKLGVHSERDIPLAAYRANLFSILDKSTTDRSLVDTWRSGNAFYWYNRDLAQPGKWGQGQRVQFSM